MCPQESNQGSERATRELSQRGGSRGINPVSREGSQAELQAERRAFDSRPDRRKIAQSAMPFKQMENVSHYVEACSALGVPAQDLFQTVDLFEGKDMRAVVRNIHSLGRVCQRLHGAAAQHGVHGTLRLTPSDSGAPAFWP